MKIAVILFNLGGPDSLLSVRPFLFNLFRDRAILRLPFLIRIPLACLMAFLRGPAACRIYASIGGCSPLLKNTYAQAQALEWKLNSETGFGASGLRGFEEGPHGRATPQPRNSFKCFISMRYWHPFSETTAKTVAKFAPDEIIYLPLYPQFSTTTSASSFADFDRALRPWGVGKTPRIIRDYPIEPGFIQAAAGLIKPVYRELAQKAAAAGLQPPRLLFSAHGLPQKIVDTGDPYPLQCAATVAALVKALQIPGLDWVPCYQSRVGPLKWTGPATEVEIARAGGQHIPVLIAPIAFVAENSETLYEIDLLYRDYAKEKFVPLFARAPCVGTHPAFIGGLARLVQQSLMSSPESQIPSPAA